MRSHLRIACLLAVSGALVSCCKPEKEAAQSETVNPSCAPSAGPTPVAAPVAATIAPPPLNADKPTDYQGVLNVVTYAEGVYSGSAPEGPGGYETLRDMGIRTIISVDGAAPDVDAAKALGMRYVHLPIGYNGMSEERTLEIARAIKDLPGPVYVHCHHGKHRSAGAAGAAAVTLGYLTPEDAVAKMKVSGTAPNYTGLYKCVQVAYLADDTRLAKASNAFPEVWKTSGMVHTMVEIDETFDHLKLIEKAGWQAPKDHPDLVPAAVAGQLADLMRNLQDDQTVKGKPAEFKAWMLDGSARAGAVEESLVKGGVLAADISAQFKLVAASCKDCHTKYRD